MTEPIINSNALRDPRNKQLLIIGGIVLLALIIALAMWQTSGTTGARRDLAAANDKIAAKQSEVDEARRTLEEKLSELRVVKAEADARATKLGGEVTEDVRGAVDGARINTGSEVVVDPSAEYYVRDRDGRFVRVTRP